MQQQTGGDPTGANDSDLTIGKPIGAQIHHLMLAMRDELANLTKSSPVVDGRLDAREGEKEKGQTAIVCIGISTHRKEREREREITTFKFL